METDQGYEESGNDWSDDYGNDGGSGGGDWDAGGGDWGADGGDYDEGDWGEGDYGEGDWGGDDWGADGGDYGADSGGYDWGADGGDYGADSGGYDWGAENADGGAGESTYDHADSKKGSIWDAPKCEELGPNGPMAPPSWLEKGYDWLRGLGKGTLGKLAPPLMGTKEAEEDCNSDRERANKVRGWFGK